MQIPGPCCHRLWLRTGLGICICNLFPAMLQGWNTTVLENAISLSHSKRGQGQGSSVMIISVQGRGRRNRLPSATDAWCYTKSRTGSGLWGNSPPCSVPGSKESCHKGQRQLGHTPRHVHRVGNGKFHSCLAQARWGIRAPQDRC